ncbi:MAG: hypothetical protein EOM40_10465 [Clostridia bacterium]|nr:hypothetical protein [Clostridia bacterium]NCC42551.1 hypothetical protein [Clostridia bacterium]
MTYKVKRIDEDIDFGCEERSSDQPVRAIVTLTDGTGMECKLRVTDQLLYDRDIYEGDQVVIDEKQELQKVQENKNKG